jgi:uncharacterized membrane protein YvbJ
MMSDDWDDDWATDVEEEDTFPCPYCGHDIYDDAVQCPHCRNYIESDRIPNSRSRSWMQVVKITAVVLLIIFLVQLLILLW